MRLGARILRFIEVAWTVNGRVPFRLDPGAQFRLMACYCDYRAAGSKNPYTPSNWFGGIGGNDPEPFGSMQLTK